MDFLYAASVAARVPKDEPAPPLKALPSPVKNDLAESEEAFILLCK